MTLPTFELERALLAEGYRAIVGVDEAGCGALAGPVVAAAVIFPLDSRLGRVKDSKLLTPESREELYALILERAGAWAVGSASVQEISDLNIRRASLLAMQRAVSAIGQADFALVDAWTIPGLMIPQKAVIHGDRLIKSIAAASIIAKVTRDRLMRELADAFPMYGFEEHKGYATEEHRHAIERHGPCPHHRLTYRTFHPTLFDRSEISR